MFKPKNKKPMPEEMQSEKPNDLAMARSIQIKNKRKMAQGGEVEAQPTSRPPDETLGGRIGFPGSPKTVKKAMGGMIPEPAPMSMVESIMHKRKNDMQRLADGGMVDPDVLDEFDDMNEGPALDWEEEQEMGTEPRTVAQRIMSKRKSR